MSQGKVPYDRKAATRSGCWLFSCLILGFVGCLWAGCCSIGAGIAVLVGAVVVGLIPLIVLRSTMEAPPERRSAEKGSGVDIVDAGRKAVSYTLWGIILACLFTGKRSGGR